MASGMHIDTRHRMAGLSLIEMMIALVMALIVAAGIISVFTSTSSSNKVQAQMATLQEEGRFAIHSLTNDLSNANGTYCSNSGGNANGTGSGLFLDALRAPVVYSPNPIVFPDNTVALPAPTEAYSLPSSIFMRGYDCPATGGCKPVDPDTAPADANVAVGTPAKIPAMGKLAGNRVIGADVLTIRYLRPGSGWAIVPSGSATGSLISAPAGGVVSNITLRQLTHEDPIANFTGTVAMLADCSNAQVFAVGNANPVLTPSGANYTQPLDISQGSAPRVFDFVNDFQTVTYFLQVVDAGNGHTTGELVRRVNINGVVTDQPLVRGVERLDFRYGIVDASGGTRFLTANEVDTGTDASGNTIACHVPPGQTSDVAVPGGMPSAGCLWRSVQTIEVHILMDGQTPLYTLTPQEMFYLYSPDGASGGTTPVAPTAHPIQPNATQGFPNELLRREFTSLVTLRNFNP